ncbi:RNA-binding protein 8A [Intoshia linei]|uniref:RNA-binding protein 8A n=1 Tax=Intoshia linei TaxID=1819745 RepID=A0A177BCB9_9BILA|nr:RNA-binding protein 8A [Intoshia linei]
MLEGRLEDTREDSEISNHEDVKKKGRGFNTSRVKTGIKNYDTLDTHDKSAVPTRSVEGWILIVRNLDKELHEDDLRDVFEEYGKIKNLHLNIERRSGYIKGYAFIEYGTFNEAKMAIMEMDNKEINDQTISVDWTFMRGPIN